MSLAKTPIDGIYRDTSTNAIVNTNDVEYRKIIAERKKAKEIQLIFSELDLVKSMLFELRERLVDMESRSK